MSRRLTAVLAALLVAAVAAVGALAAGTAAPGITSKTIKLGGTFPLSGAASSYAPIPKGMQIYFSYINARRGPDKKRGVGGRQIIWKYVDDAYNPANTVQQTRALVEQDKVFALVGGLGTEPQQSVVDYLNQNKVPQLFVSTGATEFDKNYAYEAVDDRLAAGLRGRGRGLREVAREEPPEREDRRHLPERQLRPGLRQRPQERPRLEDVEHHLAAGLRRDGAERRRPGRGAEGGEPGRALHLRARRRRRSAPTRR